jgi:hypothetical protein
VGKTAWDSFRPPEWVDREAFLFCGADPAWTPAKEQRLASAPDAVPGKCSLCGGDGKVELGDLATRTMFVVYLEVAIEPGDPTVCGRCGRYGRQHLIDGRPAPASQAPRPEAPKEKPAEAPPPESGRTPPPAAATSSCPALVVVCAEHPDCVRRGDIHVPTKYAAML